MIHLQPMISNMQMWLFRRPWDMVSSHFDHADIYALGKAEAAFGNWYPKAGADRSSVIIRNKAGIRIGVRKKRLNVCTT